MKIVDVMTPDLETVSPNDTLTTAARLMADVDSGALPVGEDNRLIGTITGHDIAMQVAAEGLDPGKTTVGQAMSSDVLYCFESASVEAVSEKMRGWWVRRLPVVNRRTLGSASGSASRLAISLAVAASSVKRPSTRPPKPIGPLPLPISTRPSSVVRK